VAEFVSRNHALMATSHFTVPFVASYLVYSFGGLCLRNHNRSVGDVSPVFGPYLTMYAAAVIIFDIGFLIYLLFRTAWYVPIILFSLGFFCNQGLFAIGTKLRVVDGLAALVFACAGIVICPVAGFFMVWLVS
jgi:hypothetical protein